MADTALPPSQDPFDAGIPPAPLRPSASHTNDPHEDYNPLTHLNALFPSPSSLSALPAITSRLATHTRGLDAQLRSAQTAQRLSDTRLLSRLTTTQSALPHLSSSVTTLQSRALTTEESIGTLTADIARLDATKRNLVHSMTVLKRLQMLTAAYDRLLALLPSRSQYRDAAALLAVVVQLMAHFKTYRGIAQVAELSRGVADVQRTLLEQVCEEFELAFARGEVAEKGKVLREATEVVDVLGEHARLRLVNWYVNTQLREYRMVFRGGEEAGGLENIGRRYGWFARMMRSWDKEHKELFPKEWKVDEALANAFCEGTRDDYKGILAKGIREGKRVDVDLLLQCLQETLEFENGLEKRFGAQGARVSLDIQLEGKAERKGVFSQAISEAFEPYLSVWVENQDRQLASLIPKYRLQPVRSPDEDYHAQLVMPSSTELFHNYRITLAQCAKLSTGARLLELSRTFGKYLDQYCQQVLFYSLTDRAGTSGPSIEDVAIVLNTTDYCYQTTTQLEERIKSRIDEEFKERVDLQAQADAFMGIASTCIRAFVRKVEIDCEPAWREMRNISWAKLHSVGDQSGFMTSLIQRIKDRSSDILSHNQKPQYARAFTDNLVDALVTAYIGNIISCRPISESGAEQMLLDSYALKSGLLALNTIAPNTQSDSEKPPAPRNPNLAKRVTAAISRLDPLLKTLQVQPTPPEALVQAYLIHIHDRSEANFRKILDLKGIRARSETNTLVELFNAHKDSPSYSTPGNSLPDSNPILANLTTNNQQSSHLPSGSITGLTSDAAASSSSSRNVSLNLSALGMHHHPVNGGTASSTPSLLLQGATTTAAAAAAAQTRFDRAGLGEKLLTAARDGVIAVDTRFGGGGGSPALSAGSGGGGVGGPFANFQGRSGTPPPGVGDGGNGGGGGGGGGGATTLNENLRNIGKFFRRDGSGFRRTGTPAVGEEQRRPSLDRR